MTTWGDLHSQIRSWLGDTTGRYTDAKLFGYAKAAIQDMSLRLPKLATAQVTVTGGVGTMPTDWMGSTDMRVYYGDAELRLVDSLYPPAGFYSLIEGIRVAYTSCTLSLVYWAGYSVPSAYASSAVLSVPDNDIEPILWYTTAMVYAEAAGSDAMLQRWDTQGRRDDSPLIPEHRWRLMRYHDAIDIRRMARPRIALPRQKR